MGPGEGRLGKKSRVRPAIANETWHLLLYHCHLFDAIDLLVLSSRNALAVSPERDVYYLHD